MNAARVELMASAVGKIGAVTWHHLFLLATDASGNQSYLRAGPESLPRAQFVGRQTEHGDALEDYEPPAAGPCGVIRFSSATYEAGAVDFDPAAANVPLASGEAAAKLWDVLQNAAKALEEEQIPYDPVGRNANWASMELLRRCGARTALPPKRWAPGASRLASEPAPDSATRRVGQAIVV